jgi:hypothetical protein
MRSTHRPARALGRLWLGVALALACGSDDQPPQILTIADQTIQANQTLQLDVNATDPDTDSLVFGMKDPPRGARIDQVAPKMASFTWTPDPSQIGQHSLTVTASDSTTTDEETFNVLVTSGVAPELVSSDRFTFDLRLGEKPSFLLEWKDDSASSLTFTFSPDPRSWGATLAIAAKSVQFDWEPTAQQQTVAQHLFTVTAVSPSTLQVQSTIAVIFRGVPDAACPSTNHVPYVFPTPIPDQYGDADYLVKADIADEESAIQAAAVIFTTSTAPTADDWYYSMLAPGDRAAWAGTIPNLGLAPGTSSTVTWFICGVDDDDPNGDRCDNEGCSDNLTFVAYADAAACPTGYTGTAGNCVDIDECLTNNGGCDPHTTCTNTPGSRTCGACPPGYSGTGETGCSASSTCLDQVTSSSRPVVPPALGDLVISEIMADPSKVSNANGEWLELWVRSAVDLNGVEILSGSASGTLTTKSTIRSTACVRPGAGHFVLTAKVKDTTKNGGLPPVLVALNSSLPNSNGQAIVRYGGVDLDRVTWATSTPGASLQLSSNKLDPTQNDAPSAWCTTPSSTVYGLGDRGSPAAANRTCP